MIPQRISEEEILAADMAGVQGGVEEATLRMTNLNMEMASAKAEQLKIKTELERVSEDISEYQRIIEEDDYPIGMNRRDVEKKIANLKGERTNLDRKFEGITKDLNELTDKMTGTITDFMQSVEDEAKSKAKSDVEKIREDMAKLHLDKETMEKNRKERKDDLESKMKEMLEGSRGRETPPRRYEEGGGDGAAKLGPQRTRSLAQLPILGKAADFTEHVQRVKTYFRLNGVTTENDKKDLLLISFSQELAQRVQGIEPEAAPYNLMDFATFLGEVRQRMVPKASSSILRSQFETVTQGADQYVIDYLLEKQSLFLKAYPSGTSAMPVSFLTRNLIEGIYHEDLKAEMWRKCSDSEETNESCDQMELTEAFNRIIDKANTSLDFVRRTNNIKQTADKKGLSLVSPQKTGTSNLQISQFGMIPRVNHLDEVEEPWVASEEDIYTVEDEEEGSEEISEEQINFCRMVEEDEQTRFWEEGCEEMLHELRKEGGGGRKLRCWVCNSDQHLKQSCPTRLRVVSQQVNAVIAPGGGRGTRRGWSRGTRTWGRSAGGRGRASPTTAPSSSAPFGFGRGGRPQFYPPGVQPAYFPGRPKQNF